MERDKSYSRREQIVDATLDLLADTALDKLSTRQIARRVGVSQPALFRHFRTRDAILEAVIDRMRERLSVAAARLLEDTEAPLDRSRGLVRLLFETAERHPGLVRLVLAEAMADERCYQTSLSQLVSMQRSFFAAFVRKARRRGDVPQGVDPEVASRLVLALVQGTLLAWVRDGREEPLGGWVDRVCDLWVAGLRSAPESLDESADGTEPALSLRQVSLDVRPILSSGKDPLDAILALLARLSSDGMAVVVAPFRPKPLIALLNEEGYRTRVEELGDRQFQVVILAADAPDLVDLGDLEAPLPLEHVLITAAALEPDTPAHFRVPRVPRLLLPRLAQRNVHHELYEQLDGRALLSIWRGS